MSSVVFTSLIAGPKAAWRKLDAVYLVCFRSRFFPDPYPDLMRALRDRVLYAADDKWMPSY